MCSLAIEKLDLTDPSSVRDFAGWVLTEEKKVLTFVGTGDFTSDFRREATKEGKKTKGGLKAETREAEEARSKEENKQRESSVCLQSTKHKKLIEWIHIKR